MPVVAVGLAAFSVASAASVGIAALSAFEIIGTVGAVVGAVGAVTKNKTLTKIGMIAGIVGGVGSFATSQGWISDPLKATSGIGKGVTPFQEKMSLGALKTSTGTAFNAAQATQTATYEAGQAAIAQQIVDAGSDPAKQALLRSTPVATAAADITKTTADVAGTSSGFLAFAEKNPAITFGAITTLGTAAAGAFDPSVGPGIEKTNAETAALTADTALKEQQRLNMLAPLGTFQPKAPTAVAQATPPVVYTRDPVTGKMRAPGLINAYANTVTGVPA
jgi:hypothetical protein